MIINPGIRVSHVRPGPGMADIHSWGLSSSRRRNPEAFAPDLEPTLEYSIPPKVIEDFLLMPAILHLD